MTEAASIICSMYCYRWIATVVSRGDVGNEPRKQKKGWGGCLTRGTCWKISEGKSSTTSRRLEAAMKTCLRELR